MAINKMRYMNHIFGWLFIILISWIFVDKNFFNFQIWVYVFVWAMYFIVFYINFLVLMPALLFKKKIWKYLISSALLLTVTFVAVKTFDVSNMKLRMGDRYERVMKDTSPDPGHRFEKDRLIARMSYDPFSRHNRSFSYGLLIAFISSVALRLVQKISEDEKKRSEMEKDKVTTELAYLKQQINPHFLFNTLNSIYSLTISRSEASSDAILKLSSILRYMLYQTDNERVLLSDEVQVIDDYINLQKLRLTDKTKVDVNINGNLVGYTIEPMLLIPILENAFKYGVDSVEDSYVDVDIDMEGSEFSFIVKNRIVKTNNIGNPNSGIGIKNIKRRLELLYNDEYILSTVEQNGEFCVSLKLNLRQK